MDKTALKSSLSDLALDLRWSLESPGRRIMETDRTGTVEISHNAWLVLPNRPQAPASTTLYWMTEKFVGNWTRCSPTDTERRESRRWFQTAHPDTNLTAVAYFSMEFMLSDAPSHLFRRPRQRGRRPVEVLRRSWRPRDRRDGGPAPNGPGRWSVSKNAFRWDWFATLTPQ